MPLSDPIVPSADISGWNQPCDDTGGDYYDFIPLQDGRLAIALADVSGHGLGSALIMAAARSYLRAFVHADLTPGALLSRVNDLLCHDLGDGRFVTMFFCVLDSRTRQLTYASAGHEAPLILRPADGRVDSLPSTGFPLGVMPGGQYEDGPPTLLNSGDLFVILTDGVREAMNRHQEQFGRQRLLDTLRQHVGRPAKEVIQNLHTAVQAFRGQVRQQDDITIIVAKGVEAETPLEEIVLHEAEGLDEVMLEEDKG